MVGVEVGALAVGAALALASTARARVRRGSRPAVRLLIEPYRNDRAGPEALAATFAALHALLGPGRTLALEVHFDSRAGGEPLAWFAVVCPAGLERHVQAALRRCYPNVRLRALRASPACARR